jgi:hypothetical protein
VLKYLKEQGIEFVPINTSTEDFKEFEVVYKNEEGCFGIVFNCESRNSIESLGVYKLKKNVLDGLFGDNLDKHLQFLPGVTPWEDILKHNNFFLMRPVHIK